jgi:hypothetical protein
VNLVSLQGTKPSLFDLWTMYQLDMGKLNIMAGVPVGTVYAMIGNQPVRRENAQKVLDKLSTLFHQEYTLETVYVALIEEEAEGSFG